MQAAQDEALRNAERVMSQTAAPQPAYTPPPAPKREQVPVAPPRPAPVAEPVYVPPPAPKPVYVAPAPKPAPVAPKPAPVAAVVKPAPAVPAVKPAPVAEPVYVPPPAPGPTSAEALKLSQDYARERSKSTGRARDELYQRGITAMRAGDYQQAAENFRQVLLLDPNDTDAQQALARAEKAWEREQEEQGLSGY